MDMNLTTGTDEPQPVGIGETIGFFKIAMLFPGMTEVMSVRGKPLACYLNPNGQHMCLANVLEESGVKVNYSVWVDGNKVIFSWEILQEPLDFIS